MRRAFAVLVFVALLAAGGAAIGMAAEADADQAAAPTRPQPGPATPLLSARRLPELVAAPVADNRLRAAVQPFLDQSTLQECLVVEVDGRRVVAADPSLALIPASNQKLLTGFAALEILGAEHRFVTSATSASAPVAGVVEGDLWLVGGGDPLLVTDDYAATFADDHAHTRLEDLADAVVAAGVTQVRGAVLADESRYDDLRAVPAWPNRTLTRSKPGALSAVAVNKGFATYPTAGAEGVVPELADDPATAAAARFATLLADRGVVIDGGASEGAGTVPAVEIGRVESPPLAEIVATMSRTSDNTVAEMLLKELGVARGLGGSTAGGVEAMRAVLGEAGLPLEGVELADGSGLATNRVTCDLLAGVLITSGRDSVLSEGLPVAGESGTLRNRFVGTDAAGRLRAKSGFVNQATALSGWVDSLGGSTLAFAYVGNDDFVADEEVRLQEVLADALVHHPRDVDLADLDPIS